MEEIIKKIIENDLEDLRGLKISGKVPVDPAFINELIAGFLKQGDDGSESTANPAAPSPLPEVDWRNLLSKHIKKLEVDVERDKIVLHFDIRIS